MLTSKLLIALTAALLVTALAVVILALVCRGMDRELMARSRRIRHQAERIRDYRAELSDQEAELVLLREACDRLTVAATPESLPELPVSEWEIVCELAAALDAADAERARLQDALDVTTAAYERRTRQAHLWRDMARGLGDDLRQARADRDQAISTSQQLRVGLVAARERLAASREEAGR